MVTPNNKHIFDELMNKLTSIVKRRGWKGVRFNRWSRDGDNLLLVMSINCKWDFYNNIYESLLKKQLNSKEFVAMQLDRYLLEYIADEMTDLISYHILIIHSESDLNFENTNDITDIMFKNNYYNKKLFKTKEMVYKSFLGKNNKYITTI